MSFFFHHFSFFLPLYNFNPMQITEIEIKFETSFDIEAPHSYFIHLTFLLDDDKCMADLQWKYFGREKLSVDEITEEGYTGEDDFEWQGEISKNLQEELLFRLRKVQLSPEKVELPDHQNFFSISIKDNEGKKNSGNPKDQNNWEYFLQEIIQGIYETAGKERPLEVIYRHNMPGGKYEKVSLQISFAGREVIVRSETDMNDSLKTKNIPWLEGREIITQIFNLDFVPNESILLEEPLNKIGGFIEIGEGIWYEMGKTVKNFSKRRDDILSVEKIFSRLLR